VGAATHKTGERIRSVKLRQPESRPVRSLNPGILLELDARGSIWSGISSLFQSAKQNLLKV